jgi:hypothetical protein
MRPIRVISLVFCCLFSAGLQAQGAQLGSGFFVSTNGHVLTNYHVIKGCSRVQIGTTNLAMREGSVIATDEQNDLALIATNNTPTSIGQFRATTAKIGENSWAFGFPLAGLLARSGNFTGGIVSAAAGVGNDSRMLQITTPVQPGNSGGPLLDQAGNIIGVVVAKLDAISVAAVINDLPQNVNFAIKGGIAADFLEANGVNPVFASSTKPLEQVEVAERAKSFTVQIGCEQQTQQQRVAAVPTQAAPATNANTNASLENRVTDFVITMERLSSSPLSSAVQPLSNMYEATVDYYGKHFSRDEVIADKARYFTRWPERTYSIIPGSLKVDCDPATRFCTAEGTLQFSVRNQTRQVDGTATFTYGLNDLGNRFLIHTELGAVLERRTTTQ